MRAHASTIGFVQFLLLTYSTAVVETHGHLREFSVSRQSGVGPFNLSFRLHGSRGSAPSVGGRPLQFGTVVRINSSLREAHSFSPQFSPHSNSIDYINDSHSHSFEHFVLGHAQWTRLEDCQMGDVSPFYMEATYDHVLIQFLFVIMIGNVFNCFVVIYHFTHAAHPKFYLLLSRKAQILTHISCGSIEIIIGVISWFAPYPQYWVRIMCGFSFLHASSAFFLVGQLFGTKLFTEAMYIFCIFGKYYLIVNVFANPDCYLRFLSLVIVHHIYAWFRISYVLFSSLRIAEPYLYTLSTVTAGAIPLAFVSPFFMIAFMVLLLPLYVLVADCIMTKKTAILKRKEYGRNFDLDTFKCPFLNTASLEDFKKKDPTKEEKARVVFDMLDKDGDGYISNPELLHLLSLGGIDAEDSAKIMNRYASNEEEKLTFDEFYTKLEYLWSYLYDDIVRQVAKNDEKEEYMRILEQTVTTVDESDVSGGIKAGEE